MYQITLEGSFMVDCIEQIDSYTSMRMPMIFVDIGDFSLNSFVEHFEKKGTEVLVLQWDYKNESVFDFEERVESVDSLLLEKENPVVVMFTELHAYTPEMQQAVLDIHLSTDHMVFGNICDYENLVGLEQNFIDTFTIVS